MEQEYIIAAFDFDKTITQKDTFNDIIIYKFGWLRFIKSLLKIFHLILLYLIDIVPNHVPKERIFSYFFSGLEAEKFKDICKEYSLTRIDKIIRKECREKIKWHREQGHKLVIVSASIEDWIKPWADANFFEDVIAAKPEIKEEKLTGKFEAGNCYGEEKANKLLEKYPNRKGYILYVYGDGKGDKKLLNIADKGFYRRFWSKEEKVQLSQAAIVTDGLWRKSLSAIRSLGKADFHVSVIGDSIFTTGFWSRFTRKRIQIPSASNQPEKFGEGLLKILEKHDTNLKPILFPMEDASLMWVANNIKRFTDKVHVLIPPLEALNIAQDKGETTSIAEAEGIPCPETWKPSTVEEFILKVKELEEGSFIVKPRTGSGSAGVVIGEPLQDEIWEKHWAKYGPLLIQERIPKEGHGFGVSILMNRDSECLAYFAHERLREYPVSGGPSTDRISVCAPELVEISIKLLKRLSWQGVAMVEWKQDIRDGVPKFMEINPRFWGSLELAVRAGINFPVLYAKAAIGESMEPIENYLIGVRCRWMIPGELLRYLTQPKEEREKVGEFLRGLPVEAEEWDRADISGTIASVVCPAVLLLNPCYWRYLRRNR